MGNLMDRGEYYKIQIRSRWGGSDYATCVKISTDASIKEMIPPGALVMFTPLIVGIFFGVDTLSGVLAGSLVSSVQVML
jgi:Na+/H+-translocating membrane pyrophosphatase